MKSILKYHGIWLILFIAVCTACSKEEIYEPIVPEALQSTKFNSSSNTLRITMEGNNKKYDRLLPKRTVVFKNQIWYFTQKRIITNSTYDYINQLWSSSDGINFSLQGSVAARWSYHRILVAFDNQLWLIGDQGTSGIWRSEDGIKWLQVHIIPPFRNTSAGAVVVFKGKMFVFEENPGGVRRVFSSTNGRSWHLENSSAFSTIQRGRPIVYKNTLYYVVGRNTYHSTTPGAIHDIYKSTNGRDWSTLNRGSVPFPTTTIFGGLNWFGMVVFEDKMWIIGGATANGTPHDSEIWYSSDMIRWTKYKGTVPFGWMRDHTAITFNDRIFLMGGYKKSENYYSPESSREIWSIRSNRGLHLYK